MEYKAGVDNINWWMCERAIREGGGWTLHYDHRHGRWDKVKRWDIRDDLRTNGCRQILGPEWANY